MPNRDRRTLVGKAVAVETALRIVSTSGLAAAIDYMYENGITSDIALRVLSGPQFQRSYIERRQHERAT